MIYHMKVSLLLMEPEDLFMGDRRLIQGLQEGRSSLTHMEVMLLMAEAHFPEKIHQRLIVQRLICLDI